MNSVLKVYDLGDSQVDGEARKAEGLLAFAMVNLLHEVEHVLHRHQESLIEIFMQAERDPTGRR